MSHSIFRWVPLLLILGFTACSSETNNNGVLTETTIDGHTVTEINIAEIPEETTEIGLSEFFDGFNVIPLESSEEALAMNAMATYFADDFFLLGTQTSGAARVLRFDYDGNYLNTIGKEGGGPGEHRGIYIQTLQYDEDRNTVLTIWDSIQGAQLFRPDGTHLQDITLPIRLVSNIARWSDDEWFSYGTSTGRPLHPSDSVKMAFYTADGTLTKQIERTNYPPANTPDYTPSGNASMFSFNGTRKIYFPGDRTIYRIEDRELVPEAVIRVGENAVPYNEIITPDDMVGAYFLEFLSETDRNWFIKKSTYTEADFEEYPNRPGQWRGRIDLREELLVIDKETNKGRAYTFTDDLLYLLPDQMSERFPRWQQGFGAYMALPPNAYVKFQEMSENIDRQSPEVSKKLEVLDDISMDDNYIIFMFPFRDKIEIN